MPRRRRRRCGGGGEHGEGAGGGGLPGERRRAGQGGGGQPLAPAGSSVRRAAISAPEAARRRQHPGHAVDDGVAVAGDVGDDGRGGAGGRLGDGHAPALGHRRAGQHPRPAVERHEVVVGEAARQADPLRARRRRRRGPRGARARRPRPRSRARGRAPGGAPRPARVIEGVEALHRHEPADGHDERVGRRGPDRGRSGGRRPAARRRRGSGRKSELVDQLLPRRLRQRDDLLAPVDRRRHDGARPASPSAGQAGRQHHAPHRAVDVVQPGHLRARGPTAG